MVKSVIGRIAHNPTSGTFDMVRMLLSNLPVSKR